MLECIEVTEDRGARRSLSSFSVRLRFSCSHRAVKIPYPWLMDCKSLRKADSEELTTASKET